MDLKLNKAATASSYRELLVAMQKSDVVFKRHRDYSWSGKNNLLDSRTEMYIRHDVDRRLDRALVMARLENQLGVRSTYYFLHPGDYGQDKNYYGEIVDGRIVHAPELIRVVSEIYALGHEVGLHNDFLQLSSKMKVPVDSLIRSEIDFFRKIGIPICGTASHGSEFVKGLSCLNYDIFSECYRTKSVKSVKLYPEYSFNLGSVSMASLGLVYEAYSIKRDLYISDSSGKFSAGHEIFGVVTPQLITDLILNRKCVVALFHPDWWEPTLGEAGCMGNTFKRCMKVISRKIQEYYS